MKIGRAVWRVRLKVVRIVPIAVSITHRFDIVLEQHVTQIGAALVALNVQLSLEIKPSKIYELVHFPFSALARILRLFDYLHESNVF